ncbi:MAG: helix-turn-helix transcriptional regulator [Clostridia bacterium]|nr:helix-turn-helix transcriptional regulator [Clostridia bacterium]
MDQSAIGQYIAKKRKEKNWTQEQLAEKLGVSNKTISKWENGKCMPDYGIIENLCRELDVGIAALMDGEDTEESSIRLYDDAQILDLIKRTQTLESQKNTIYGVLLIVMGFAMHAVSRTIGGTDFQDFLSGLLLGLSVGVMLVGIYYTGRSLMKK